MGGLSVYPGRGEQGIQGIQGTPGAPGNGMQAAAGAGTVNAITAIFTPVVALIDRTLVAVVSLGANTVANPTFSPDGLAAQTITARGGAALVIGDTGPVNYVMLLEYSLANTRWELLNPAKQIVPNSEIRIDTFSGLAAAVFGTANTGVVRFTTTRINTGAAFTHTTSAANGSSVVINEAGLYAANGSLQSDTNQNYSSITKNSGELTSGYDSITPGNTLSYGQATAGAGRNAPPLGATFRAVAGDVIRLQGLGTPDINDPANSFLRIVKISD